MSWAVRYKPTSLDGLILHPAVRDELEIYYKLPVEQTPNLLFYGQPGRGKTAVARIFSEREGYGAREHTDFSQPENQGRNKIKQIISGIAQPTSLRDAFFPPPPKRHLFILDEFHIIEDKGIQQQFNHALENNEKHHYIFLTNRQSILAPNFQDRLNPVNFSLDDKELAQAQLKKQIPVVSRKILEFFNVETKFTDGEFLEIYKRKTESFRDYVRALEIAHYKKLSV